MERKTKRAGTGPKKKAKATVIKRQFSFRAHKCVSAANKNPEENRYGTAAIPYHGIQRHAKWEIRKYISSGQRKRPACLSMTSRLTHFFLASPKGKASMAHGIRRSGTSPSRHPEECFADEVFLSKQVDYSSSQGEMRDWRLGKNMLHSLIVCCAFGE